MLSVLLTGSSGFLGSNTQLFLRGRAETIGLARRPPIGTPLGPYVTVDLRNQKETVKSVREFKPDVILHIAAIAGHETAAKDPQQAYAVNVEMTRVLSELACDLESQMVYFSTDALFSGSTGSYSECDPVAPFSYYGETKAEGEEAVRDAISNHLIVRTNFFGWSETGDKSILEFFVNSLRAGRSVSGYPDFVVTSIYVTQLIDVVWDLIRSRQLGTFNVASGDALSKYDFGLHVADAFDLDRGLIAPQQSTHHESGISRSRNLSLKTDKVSAALQREMPTQRDGILAAKSSELTLVEELRMR